MGTAIDGKYSIDIVRTVQYMIVPRLFNDGY